MNDIKKTGRVRPEDIAAIRDNVRIDDVIRDYVTLKNAGGGSLKGLCPFHDERSPSFHVTPSRGLWYCFGCAEGGDVIDFVRKVEHLTFNEAIEKLAGRGNITLELIEADPQAEARRSERLRIVEANKQAARFYQSHLAGVEAETAREFLTARGFDQTALEQFMVGYAPRAWDSLTAYLKGLRFTDEELVTSGLAVQGNRGVYDRFRGRIIWPIRDLTGDVIGFGARKLYDDDEGPKYLNTPETPAYKKSQVLYGIDAARKTISKEQKAVIVEGYTDVMACHLAGVTNAVATCGTAFGEGHIKVLRRLLLDDSSSKAEVIFTFDGDKAGQKAAMRAFEDDQRFAARTYVAVAGDGMDPCELRLAQGDEGIQRLLSAKVPLFQFVIRTMLDSYHLGSPEGRVAALRDTAPIVARVKDQSLRPEYARSLAGWIGLNVDDVMREVAAASRRSPGEAVQAPETVAVDSVSLALQKEALRVVLQDPSSVVEWYRNVDDTAFTHPIAQSVHAAIITAGGPKEMVTGSAWSDRVLAACGDDSKTANAVRALLVEPTHAQPGAGPEYGISVIARLMEMDASRAIEELKGSMTRADADGDTERSILLLGELMALESYKKELQATSLGLNAS